jgi:hypothetical protein
MKISNMYFLLGITFSIFSSEEKRLVVECGVLSPRALVYCDKKYIDDCNAKYNTRWSYNEPFLKISFFSSQLDRLDKADQENKIGQELKKMTHVPFSLFVTKEKVAEPRIKNLGEELFTLKCKKASYALKGILDSDFKGVYPLGLVNRFKEEPNYPAHAEKDLLDEGIITEVYGDVIHGPNGFLGIEGYNKKLWECKKKTFFSYTKKPFLAFSFLFSCYLLWTIYSKYC